MSYRQLFLFTVLSVLATMFFSSCRVLYPSDMFRQKDYQYFDLAQKQLDEYLIQPGDQFTLRLYARDGFKLIDVLSTQGGSTVESSNQRSFNYIVDKEGFVKLPVIGDLFVKGYTERGLEKVLAEKYASLFVDPWASVRVVNRRAFVFRGSTARVVPLAESPISIIELIAISGGLDPDAKAFKIKVIRGDIKNPQIYMVDLSTLEGIRKADLSVQPGDIVLIQRRRRAVTDILRELTPYMTAITTISTFIILWRSRLGQQ